LNSRDEGENFALSHVILFCFMIARLLDISYLTFWGAEGLRSAGALRHFFTFD
jgi:hypothetical protein